MRIGWFSTGRDEAARKLLREVSGRISEGFIPRCEIAFVFCNRERGESRESDEFLSLCESLGLKTLSLSSKGFLPQKRLQDPEGWRELYHQEVLRLIEPFGVDLGVLAGYMLIVSPRFCKTLKLINLHPALPGGPVGTWQEVIHRLIEERAERTGAMIHLVTKELDRGPVLSFFSIGIRGGAFDPLWEEVERGSGEDALFRLIRQEEERREVPLLVLTLKALSEGRVRIEGGRVIPSAIDLSREVEEYMRRVP